MIRREHSPRYASIAFGVFWLLLGLGSLLELLDVATTTASEAVRVLVSTGSLIVAFWLWRRSGYAQKTFQSRALLTCIVIAALITVARLFFG